MLHRPSPIHDNNRNLPRRMDSLAPAKAAFFTEVDEELHDIRRVHIQGQEEDLRYALGRVINRVEELSSLLKEAYKVQTDLQTEATLAKSNLQLALANNEMLEDALKRDASNHGRDIGWRRLGAKAQKELEAEEGRRRSIDSPTATSSGTMSPPPQSPGLGSAPLRPATASGAPAVTDNRFFKFRFGGPATASTPQFPRLPASTSGVQSAGVNGAFQSAHLTSASLPSLVPAREKELEDLNTELERERDAHKTACAEKEALEAELESLSQALFEEANKMVAIERRRLAETEDELRETQAEREALRNALRLVSAQQNAASVGSTNAIPDTSSSQQSDTLTLKDSTSFSDEIVTSDPEAMKVREWRCQLQETLLNPHTMPKPEDMPELDKLFSTLETYNMTISYLEYSKIGKVVHHICALSPDKIPRDEEFKFQERARSLISKWQDIIGAAQDADNVSVPTNIATSEESAQSSGGLSASETVRETAKAEVTDTEPRSTSDAETEGDDKEKSDSLVTRTEALNLVQSESPVPSPSGLTFALPEDSVYSASRPVSFEYDESPWAS